MYQYPCGVFDDDPESWKCEVACLMVGCQRCKNFNGTEYYNMDVKKGLAMWAKHEIDSGDYNARA